MLGYAKIWKMDGTIFITSISTTRDLSIVIVSHMVVWGS